MQGRDDDGTTAVVAVEVALRLSAGVARPGVLAPAEAFDPADVLNALKPCGVAWRIDLEPPRSPT